MTTDFESLEGRPLPLKWMPYPDVPLLAGHYFNIVLDEDGVQLTIGQTQPPLLAGDAAMRADVLRSVGSVGIKPVGRYQMSLSRAGELRDLLSDMIRRAEASGEDPQGGVR